MDGSFIMTNKYPDFIQLQYWEGAIGLDKQKISA